MLLDLATANAKPADDDEEIISKLKEALNVENWGQYEASEEQ
jgi:hypothetical protein